MEKKAWTRDKNEGNATEPGQVTRNSKVNYHCNRKSKTKSLRQWETSDNQFNNKAIEEYNCNSRSKYCSGVYIVVPTGENASLAQEKFAKLHPEKVLVCKSEYDISELASNIFSRDSIGHYIYDVQSKTCLGEKVKSTRTTDARKSDKGGISQKRVFKQTHRECPVVAIKNLASDAIIPRKESFESQASVSKPRFMSRSGGKHRQRNHINKNYAPITCSRSDSSEQVTCPSHVYTFKRGLVPSKEAHSLELLHTSHFLPPVVADRVGSISEHKHYRLSLEKGWTNSNNANYFLNALHSYDLDEKSLEHKTEPKSVVYKEFSAESIIPASYGKRRYFDFQGYIDFLCKERNLRKASEKQMDRVDDWRRLESSPWLDNLGNVLVRDVYDYSRMLDIKGFRIKLDENPLQMRYYSKPVSESHQHYCLGTSNDVYLKPHMTKVAHLRRNRQKPKTVFIERLPSKFQFPLPGRSPSSDDSGFAE